LDIDIAIRCYGEYSCKIINPILFYSNVCDNITVSYMRDSIDSQLKTKLMNALLPSFGKISAMGIRYYALPANATEISGIHEYGFSATNWRSIHSKPIRDETTCTSI
jgi:membrane protease subunit (stomatin/prohibitin family)